MENIIVYGIKRTGTSLMTEILSKNKKYIVNKDGKLENNINYKNLQKYYNEGIFVSGINNKNYLDYIKLNNNIIKIMHHGLISTNIKYFKTFKKILIMNRPWRDQTASTNNLSLLNIKNSYEKIKNNINYSIEEYYNDYKYNDGIEYGYNYSNLIIDMIKRNYYSHIIIIDFNKLINDHNYVISILNKYNLDISNKVNIIDKKQTKYISTNKKNLKEFRKGFFNFLDKLYNSLKICKIDNSILKLINEWMPHMVKNIQQREIKIYNKYNIIYSDWLNNLIKSKNN